MSAAPEALNIFSKLNSLLRKRGRRSSRKPRGGETAEQVAVAKSQALGGLVRERKLGYLALLCNVRNILTHAPDVADELCKQLAGERAVRKSLVFPFQFLSAVEVLKQGDLPGADRAMDALKQAIDHALANVPKFDDNTLVALDSSGSMVGTPQTIGALFAATLVKAMGADLMLFSDDARYVSLIRAAHWAAAALSSRAKLPPTVSLIAPVTPSSERMTNRNV